MGKEAKDLWELNPDSIIKDCDTCKWENKPLEEKEGDGYAPCKRCINFLDD